FQKRGDSSVQIESAISGVPTGAGSLDSGRGSASPERLPGARNGRKKIWETISARLMAEFGTTCLVLNERYEILHSFGQPQRFLTVHPGRASLNVLKLVPRALSLALSGALRRAGKAQQSVGYSRIPLPGRGRGRTIDLKLEPLAAEADEPRTMLVFRSEPTG